MRTWVHTGRAQEEGSPGTNPPTILCVTWWEHRSLRVGRNVVVHRPVAALVLCVGADPLLLCGFFPPPHSLSPGFLPLTLPLLGPHPYNWDLNKNIFLEYFCVF